MVVSIDLILENLNEAQKEAVMALDGPVLVLAGAGSGKTRVLTHRIAYLLATRDVAASRVVAVTFTNKAAQEMRERLVRLVGDQARALWMGTFHALGLRILREHAHRLGYPRDFVVLDREDQRRLLKEILHDDADPQAFLEVLSRYKQRQAKDLDPEDADRIRRYEQTLRELGAMDFDDLLLKTLELLDAFPDIAETYAEHFLYIHVDEYQDTNRIQYELLKRWSRVHGNLFAVGDEDQAIYGFRGADIRNVLEFQKDFPGARVIHLEENYRSTRRILEAANAVIAHNRARLGKRLFTRNETGTPLRYFQAQDEYEEAMAVATLIRSLSRSPGEVLILYRTNAQSRALEEAFRRMGIPYKLVGTTRFYERKEIKDLLAYLRVMVQPADRLSLLRILNVPPRKIGDRTQASLMELAASEGISLYEAMARHPSPALRGLHAFFEEMRERARALPVADLTREVIHRVGYEAYIRNYDGDERKGRMRWENVEELLASMTRFAQENPPGTVEAYLEHIALWTSMDEPLTPDAVTLMTVHMAKGLEFPVVIITGLEETVFPHQNAVGDEIEEERRLFYVALTRAREEVYLFWARTRGIRRFYPVLEPSRFLREIPEELKEPLALAGFAPAPEEVEPHRPEPAPASFRRGARVFHKRFGYGQVLHVEGDQVKVQFPDKVRTILAGYLTPA